MIPLGEFPCLPLELVLALHQRTAEVYTRVADAAWQKVADAVVAIFEGLA